MVIQADNLMPMLTIIVAAVTAVMKEVSSFTYHFG